MNQPLRPRLRSLRGAGRLITPDQAWVQATRQTLIMQVGNSLPVQRMSFVGRVQEFFRTMVVGRVMHVVRRPLMGALSILAIGLGGSVLSVSAAERSLPGDFFYGLKLVTEQARLALTSTKDEKLKLKTEFTERRVSDLQRIATKDETQQEQVVQVAEILKRDLNTLKQQLTEVNQEVSPAAAVAAARLVDQKTNQVISDLQATKAQLPDSSKEAVTDVQSAAADTGIKAIEVLAQKHEDANDDVSAVDIAQAIQDHTKAVTDATSSTPPLTTTSTSLALASTSTTNILVDVTSSIPIIVTSSTLPGIMTQVKDMTTQAFAQQKVKDQLAASASSTTAAMLDATSTTAISGSVSSTAPGGNASSTMPTGNVSSGAASSSGLVVPGSGPSSTSP